MTVFSALLLLLALAGPPAEGAGRPLVKIHEVLGGRAGYLDLHNTGSGTAELGGWTVQSCDGHAVPTELATLPAGSALAPGAHFLVVGLDFGGTAAQQVVVPSITGTGETLLDRRRARVDSVAWDPASPCREKDAAVPCPGLAESRDAFSRDTDDNRADFGCVPPADSRQYRGSLP
ncbi:lamin tail domain-containing protein [Amycolatopsis sp. CA-230715]|uniref:lamin tail domain-containing protein n=1 Tax=Amycolatopsis sp. CA-230715 TaxID=2745196 RepID=UPI001C0115A0|nr:lamin tail domain-containing protein [Amycolatopsis sp. CA-230715]QWF85939.1 hypothetical protein HUW46_09420 [Amycolatopsis sp. CA-230715]